MALIEELFYQGEYVQVLEKTYEDQKKINRDVVQYTLGSLSFLGRTEECEAFFNSQEKNLSAVQKAYGHFFLALAWTRKSQYKKARSFLKLNQLLNAAGQFEDLEIKFLVAQGISFFLYYLGQFEKSLYWSKKSLTASMALGNFWMKSLALDILGNTLIQNGQIFEGLQHLQLAIKFSKIIRNKSLVHAIETSDLIFKNEYGVEIKESFQLLQLKFKSFASHDNFSKSNLGLELARQWTLRGEFQKAAVVLDSVASAIYEAQNRRQEVRFNLRWAELCYLKNELSTAVHFIRSGKKSLNYVDQTYEIQLLGLEIKVKEKLGEKTLAAELKMQLLKLSEKFKSVKNQNILLRQSQIQSTNFKNSDDEINLLLQKAEQSPEEARKIILQTHFFSWLYRFFDLLPGVGYLILNFEAKSITCVDANSICHKPETLSSLNYKILNLLSEGFKTKQQLLESIWGYQYDPLRHDSLIYSAFLNLRKILGEHSNFLETTEMGYHLKATVLDHQLKTKVTWPGKTSPDYVI